ncbi:DUF5610 domain-containing protein [Zooshikella ganghwensis]|uniref:DUF5610 domain-containing protein n=1 Tax=Zooshikella ganghwensis TaxID=202772 RepID=A0A4P9VKS2_9GAMM|nr:DUF5610 domain-containing protein [Zooshikella ganghwensis]RDH43905.1 hypothetical protein B9G39_10870 [Zooshikella ganghwensis]
MNITPGHLLNSMRPEHAEQYQQAATNSQALMRSSAGGSTRQLLQNTLLQRVGQQLGAEEPLKAESSRYRPEQVADTILKFVEQRLVTEQSEGADSERLQNLLGQAREGVAKGFAQAREDLQALGLLNPNLEADIDTSFDLVSAGLDELQSKFTDYADKISLSDIALGGEPQTTSLRSHQQYYQLDNQFSFQVTTKEGDVVTINAFKQFSAANGYLQQGQATVSTNQAQYQSGFQLSVEGDLNESELNAINALLADVTALAIDFFEGNVSSAFDQALSLGIDASMLSEFSLTLQQTEVQQMQQAYASANGGGFEVLNNRSPITQLADFGQQLQNTYQKVGQLFDQPGKLLAKLLSQLEPVKLENNKRQESVLNEELVKLQEITDYFLSSLES